jgi:hypothetical protein
MEEEGLEEAAAMDMIFFTEFRLPLVAMVVVLVIVIIDVGYQFSNNEEGISIFEL